ncbi:MAG TPA: GGDEF domain-containing protein [Eoetvoesiella sp.]
MSDTSAMDALRVHLNLLQVFLPVDGWLVGKLQDSCAEVVATLGHVDIGRVLSELALSMPDGWDSRGSPEGFSHRFFSGFELGQLEAPQSKRSLPQYVLRALLQPAYSNTSGVLLGFSSTENLPQKNAKIHTREISLCLKAIEHTLRLHVDLDEAHQRVLETQERAQIDSLTQVLNRAGWNQRLRYTGNGDADCAIAFVDLDFLKYVNDTRGHIAGDQLLQLTAQSIMSVLRSGDCVARLGGDEFAVMLHDVTAADAYQLKGRIKLALREFGIRASIGVALKSEGNSVQGAMELADVRMYEEKRAKQSLRADDDMALDLE